MAIIPYPTIQKVKKVTYLHRISNLLHQKDNIVLQIVMALIFKYWDGDSIFMAVWKNFTENLVKVFKR